MVGAAIDEVNLKYQESGQGEPVVFIHGAFVTDAFRPLLAEPGLSKGYRLVAYTRRGYGGDPPPASPLSIAEHAAGCRRLLAHLGVARAHVVGHSLGGSIALQLAFDAPDLVRSLALLEPALLAGESADAYRESLERLMKRYRDAGPAAALDDAFSARWPDYRETMDRVIPGAFDQAVTDSAGAFSSDLPGLLAWRFGANEARQLTQPLLSMLGGRSVELSPRFAEAHELLLSWVPGAEGTTVPGAAHFLQAEQPHAVAERLAAFFARH